MLRSRLATTRELINSFYTLIHYNSNPKPLQQRTGTPSQDNIFDQMYQYGASISKGSFIHHAESNHDMNKCFERYLGLQLPSWKGAGSQVKLGDKARDTHAIAKLLSVGVRGTLNESVHSLLVADAARFLLWIESEPPENITKLFEWDDPQQIVTL